MGVLAMKSKLSQSMLNKKGVSLVIWQHGIQCYILPPSGIYNIYLNQSINTIWKKLNVTDYPNTHNTAADVMLTLIEVTMDSVRPPASNKCHKKSII